MAALLWEVLTEIDTNLSSFIDAVQTLMPVRAVASVDGKLRAVWRGDARVA